MTTPLLWSLEETARQLGGVSTRTVRRLLERGDLPAVRIGRRVTVPAEAVRHFITQSIPAGHMEPPAAAAHNLQCAGPDVRKGVGTCRKESAITTVFTGAAIRRSGGPATPTQAARELAAVLEQPTEGKRRRC
jgi:excisionase family DNA binding protein